MSHWMEIKSGMHYMKNYRLRKKLTKCINFNDLYFHQIFIQCNIEHTVFEKDHLGDWSPEKYCC